MPVHEFICECGEQKEEIVPINTKTIKCSNCGKDMKKIISLSSFHLRGGGWADTGYSKERKPKEH